MSNGNVRSAITKPIMANEATLRDTFAAAALTGLSETAWTRFQHNVSTDPIAVLAYELAGAMLREREKQCK